MRIDYPLSHCPLLLEKQRTRNNGGLSNSAVVVTTYRVQWSERHAVFQRRGQPAATLGNAPMLAVFLANKGSPDRDTRGLQSQGSKVRVLIGEMLIRPQRPHPSPRVSRGNPARIKFRYAKNI